MSRALRESDIRPDELNAGKEAAYARDVERLLARRGEFVEVPCPACGGDESQRRFRKYELDLRECSTCETIFVSPRPSPAVLIDYYANSELYEYWNEFIFPASEEARRDRIFRPRVEKLTSFVDRYMPGAASILEVGAGFGTFCDEVRTSGRFTEIVAVEPTPSLAQTIADRGHSVIAKPIEEVELDDASVDVVASFEVIEHLFEPLAFLRACKRVLRPGGLMVFTCPNGHGFEIDVLGEIADTIDTEHLNLFNPSALRLLSERAGFEVLEILTPGVLDADIVRNKVLEEKIDLNGHRFLRRVLIDEWEDLGEPFQSFLSEHGLSTHSWTVVRKR